MSNLRPRKINVLIECVQCAGHGVISKIEGTKLCPDCRGTGHTRNVNVILDMFDEMEIVKLQNMTMPELKTHLRAKYNDVPLINFLLNFNITEYK